MNKSVENGSWEEKKGKLKKKFAVLTNYDLLFTGGNSEELYRKLQIKLGKTRTELQEILEAL